MFPDEPNTIHGFTVDRTVPAGELDSTHIGKTVHVKYADDYDILTTSFGVLRTIRHSGQNVCIFLATHLYETRTGRTIELETGDAVSLLRR